MRKSTAKPKRKTAPKYRLKRKSYQVLSVENMTDALQYYAGNLQAIADAFRITRQTVWAFIRTHPELEPIRDRCREVMVDEGENALRNAIRREEGWAVSLVLQTLGKNRGYIKGMVMGGGVDPATGQMSPV